MQSEKMQRKLVGLLQLTQKAPIPDAQGGVLRTDFGVRHTQVAKQSKAAMSMCLWVRAMDTYAKMSKVRIPCLPALPACPASLLPAVLLIALLLTLTMRPALFPTHNGAHLQL
jgi:hypothetical protein